MNKKHYIVCLLTALMTLVAVYGFNHWQNSMSMLQLNNHNLSANAVLVKTKQNTSVARFFQLVKQSSLSDLQVQLISKQTPNLTYFFGTGDYPEPTMKTGRFFSASDFTSAQPVAVVGKNLANQLYQPKDQAYIKLNGQYVPVIGVMGGKYNTQLDNQIFVAGAVNLMGKTTIDNYHIWLDAATLPQVTPLKKHLHLKSIKHTSLVKIANPKHQSLDYKALVLLCVVVIAVLLQGLLWVKTSLVAQIKLLAKFERSVFVFQNWWVYTVFCGLGMLSGLLWGGVMIKLTSYVGILLYLGCIWLASSVVVYLRLLQSSHLLHHKLSQKLVAKITKNRHPESEE